MFNDNLYKIFGITDVNIEKVASYSYDQVDIAQLSALSKNEIPVYKNYEEVVTLKTSKGFLYFLLDYAEYCKKQGAYLQHPDSLNDYFKNKYQEWYEETIIRKKHPELQEIINDYEVMKVMLGIKK